MDRKTQIGLRLSQVHSELPPRVTLVVVTKTFPVSDLEILYDLGERNFAENRDSEGALKAEQLPADVTWHFQGGVQSNKLKSIVGWSDYIHSIDDLKHILKISELADSLGKKQRCFIQVNLDGKVKTEGRSGIQPDQLPEFAQKVCGLSGVEVVGVMGVAPLNGDPEHAFQLLQECSFALIKVIPEAGLISAGMSGDYKIAMKYGATHVRLGSSILGSR
jgi:pyridoxal phosphate enzyme (YggS family)